MKALITINEVKEILNRQEKAMYIDSATVITPAAKDFANEHGICMIQRETQVPQCLEYQNKPQDDMFAATNTLIGRTVAEVIKQLGTIPQLTTTRKRADPSGFRLVSGDGVQFEGFNTGSSTDKVQTAEVLNIKESPQILTGFMIINDTSFTQKLSYDEVNYVIAGAIECISNGSKYSAKAGDIFYSPAGTTLTLASNQRAKILYVTFPAINIMYSIMNKASYL